ncbi:MAG: T9SS type A sorting domain-containing protein [candidate division Zixibacteria bacterium]|nr:T9SS type A sorting domain-containing protein [candidate division Zixibacteria bacterium]
MVKRVMIVALSVIILGGAQVFGASPGDTIGTTYYDLQSENLAATRICVDTSGGVHFAWIHTAASSSGDRHIYYNFIDNGGFVSWSSGTQISTSAGAGFPDLGVFPNGTGAVVYHNTNNNNCNFGKDSGQGFGLFSIIDIPDEVPGEATAYWPKVSRDSSGTWHAVATSYAMSTELPFIYTYSTNDGANWASPVLVDTVVNMTPFPVSSRVSTKTAIVWGRPIDISSPDYYDSDLYYVQSADGSTWDYNTKVNVTNYSGADTLRVFTDIDAAYDYNDNLHIVWSAVVYYAGSGDAMNDSSALFHWSSATGIDTIATAFENSAPSLYDLNIAKVNIGVDVNNNLFAVWTRFTNSDKSAGGYSNGDIYYAYSTDAGNTWSTPENLTDSQSDGCTAGNCDSDHWPALAETVDQYLHILYIHDTDAGSIVQGEGSEAISQVMYYKHENPLWVGIDDKQQPREYELTLSNYPNPFNSVTVFEFPPVEEGELTVYNLLGEKVAEIEVANSSRIEWDGRNISGRELASGVYFARLHAGDNTLTRRILMLK